MDAIIVGAGIAGLNCALEFKRKGIEFVILEASDAVGGRVRTDQVDGFLLDRGFQVFLTAYPEARRVLDYSSLDLKPFYPGALVRVNRSFKRVSDPWRRPLQASRDFLSGVVPKSDQLRIGLLRTRVTSPGYQPPEKEISTLQHLKDLGINDTTIQRFFRPFFGGIFLEKELSTSQAMFEFVFRMMSTGDTSIPANGMGQIPAQMARALPTDSLRLNSKVVSLENRVVGLETGEQLSAKAVVLAGDWTSVHSLLPELPVPRWNSATCFYFAARRAPVNKPILVLSSEEEGPISNLAVLSNLSSFYAPRGQALISVSVIGSHQDVAALRLAVMRQLREWYGASVEHWREIRHYRIDNALPRQESLPPAKPQSREGIFLCGDYLENGSLNGALLSGRRVAESVIHTIRGDLVA